MFEQKKLLLKFEKCEFHEIEMKFLNFIIESLKIKINFKKFAIIKN